MTDQIIGSTAKGVAPEGDRPTDPDCVPKSGYTLPVFACAGAIAALQHLTASAPPDAPARVTLNLINPDKAVAVPIEQVAFLSDSAALAITRSDPGDNLDLTRHTPIWSVVSWAPAGQSAQIVIDGGEGVGQFQGKAAIYSYAQQLLQTNLAQHLTDTQKIKVTIILPAGRQLALRTSNAAFGVVEGLSLLGTSGIAQPLSAPGQLAQYRADLQQKATQFESVVFCLGENGLDLALQQGIAPERRIKTANWLGPLLVEAGLLGIRSILLFGYHGKLIKLAGGIFHTHHHVADGRQEILAACCVQAGLDTALIQQVLASPTTEAGLAVLKKLDGQAARPSAAPPPYQQVYDIVAQRIDQRASDYIYAHSEKRVTVGSVLFDRQRQILVKSDQSLLLLP